MARSRRAAWESPGDIETLMRTEFVRREGGFDLRPSVYELKPSETLEDVRLTVVQARSEHHAACELRLSSRWCEHDLSGLGALTQQTPGNDRFRFIEASHRELVFDTSEDLKSFLEQVAATLAGRAIRVSKSEVREYARARLAVGDQEWERAREEGWIASWRV